MKALLLLGLAMVVVARKGTAQDAPQDTQCVRERAAMVETIRAYARSAASVAAKL